MRKKSNVISKRQLEILNLIVNKVKKCGYPPTVREICSCISLNSSATVHNHLKKLEELGYIKRYPLKPRALEINYSLYNNLYDSLNSSNSNNINASSGKINYKSDKNAYIDLDISNNNINANSNSSTKAFDLANKSNKNINNVNINNDINENINNIYNINDNIINSINNNFIMVPVLGQIAAGLPILAVENIEDYFPLTSDFVKNGSEIFILKIKGDSMVNAGIIDRDYVVVRKQDNALNGEIVAVLVDDEATVKRFFKKDDYVELVPENNYMKPIKTKNVKILGKVIGVIRKYF